jgi:hypothetical protein
MSVDSKLFVTCGKDKYIEVVNAVVLQLNSWVRQKLDYHWMSNTDATSRGHFIFDKENYDASKFTNGTRISAYNLDVVSIDFGCGEFRSLKVLGDCCSDYSSVCEGHKILFSLGNWGMHQEIMNQVALAVEPFGDVYYDHNDCNDEGFISVYDFCENSSQFK